MSDSSRHDGNGADPLGDATGAIPGPQREEIEALAEQVADGGVSRRRFMLRAAQMGIGAGIAGSVLAACGSAGDSTSVAGTTDATSSASGATVADKYKNKTIGVGIFTFVDENEPVLAYHCEEAAEALDLNWKFIPVDMQASQTQAEQVVGSFVSKGVDAIIDIVTPPSLAAPQFASAKQKNIPAFGIYTGVPNDPSLVFDYGASIGADATYLMEYMIRDLRASYPDKDPIKVAIIDSKLEVVKPRRAIIDGFLGLPEYKDIQVVAEVPDVDQTKLVESSTEAAKAVMAEVPDLDAIWVNFPSSSIPVASAVSQAGKDGQVRVYGHVSNGASLEAVRQGGTPLVAVSYADLVYVSWNAVGLMLAHFQDEGKDLRNAGLTTNPVPVTAVEKEVASSGAVQKVPSLGGDEVETWLFQEGNYRQGLVEQWSEQFSS